MDSDATMADSVVQKRVADYEEKLKQLPELDSSTSGSGTGRRPDEVSTSTTTTSVSSSESKTVQEPHAGSGSDNGSTHPPTTSKHLKEDLLGTHVSFADRDDCSATTSSSGPEAGEHCSEEALMAAIAAATTKDGDESSFNAFFATAEAEALAAAEQMEENGGAEMEDQEEEEEERSAGDFFRRIDRQISSPDPVSTGKTNSVQDVLQDLERVLFFTDVIDRNPPPVQQSTTKTTTGSSALVAPSSAFSGGVLEPWWEATVQQVSNTIYQSSMEAFQEVEKTYKEVERTLLFTDLPDHAPDGSQAPAVCCDDAIVQNVESAVSPAVVEAKSTDGSVPTSSEAIVQGKAEPQVLEPEVAPKRARRQGSVRASNVAPQPELSRVLKNLEKNLLFTDLPDAPSPSSSRDRSSTFSMTLTSSSAQSFQSSLGMCRSMMGQVLADDQANQDSGELHQQLQQRMKQARELQKQRFGGLEQEGIEPAAGNKTENECAVGKSSDEVDGPVEAPVIAFLSDGAVSDGHNNCVPDLSDLSSDRGLTSDKGAAMKFKADYLDQSKGVTFDESSARETPQSEIEDAYVNDLVAVSPDRSSGQDIPVDETMSHPEDHQPAPVIKADSSTEKSVRLLVELPVNKTQSDSAASVATNQYEMSRSESTGPGDEVLEIVEEDAFLAVQNERNFISGLQDPEVVESSVSVDDRAMAVVLPNEQGKQPTEDAARVASTNYEAQMAQDEGERAGESAGYQSAECSYSCTDTYATANEHQDDSADPVAKDEQSCFKGDIGVLGNEASVFVEASRKEEKCLDDSNTELAPFTRKERESLETYSSAHEKPREAESLGGLAQVTPTESETLSASATDTTTALPSTETFDALLGEMKDLETAINVDLQRVQSVLRKNVQDRDGHRTSTTA